MKLRNKSLLFVFTSLMCLMVILFTISRQLLLAGFLKVEHEDAERNIKRVLEAFGETINYLSVKSADWSKWDDTYRFMHDHNRKYVESNLNDASLSDLKLDLMLLFDQAGNPAYGRLYDRKENKGLPVPESVLAVIAKDKSLLRHRSIESVVAGIVNVSDGPMNIVSRPILTSLGQGPIRGTLVFGAKIDEQEISRIGQITHLALKVHPWISPSLSADAAIAKGKLTTSTSINVYPHNEDTIAGYARIADLHGNPILIAHIDLPRDIYRQGIRTVSYLSYCIFGSGVIFGFILIIFLQKIVVSRVGKLSADANAIAASGDHSARVHVDGKDELANLCGAINGMLSALERVEDQFRSRNDDMRMIMNTVPSGLLSIDENYRINPEYSKSVDTILGRKDLAHKDFFETIGLTEKHPDDRKKISEFLDILLQEPLPEQEMAALNPFEELLIEHEDGRVSWIRLSYYIIRGKERGNKHLLSVLEDITEEKALSERAQKSERENIQLKAIAEDTDLFKDFLTELKNITAHAQELSTQLPAASMRPAVTKEIFRNVHTIKGMAGVYDLNAVVEIAGRLEEMLGRVGAGGEMPVADAALMGQSLAALSRSIMDVVESTKKFLGEDFPNSPDIHLRLSLEKLKQAGKAIGDHIDRTEFDEAVVGELRRKVEEELEALRLVPARRGLAKALRIMPGLMRRLEKNIIFHVEGADVPVDYETACELNGPLIHLLRNAVDHGIESPEERVMKGKEECGHIKVVFCRNDGTIVIRVADDGRGLDPHRLKRIAVDRGMLSEIEADRLTDDQAREIIFIPGFSTTDRATEISGRGIGMDAALAIVRDRLKGTLTIDSDIGKGTTFTISIPIAKGRGGTNENTHR